MQSPKFGDKPEQPAEINSSVNDMTLYDIDDEELDESISEMISMRGALFKPVKPGQHESAFNIPMAPGSTNLKSFASMNSRSRKRVVVSNHRILEFATGKQIGEVIATEENKNEGSEMMLLEDLESLQYRKNCRLKYTGSQKLLYK